MEATMTLVGGYTREEAIEAQKAKEAGAKFYIVRESLENSDWVEILDLRPLRDRVYSPLKGKRNIMRYFSDTHMVVTKKYFDKLTVE